MSNRQGRYAKPLVEQPSSAPASLAPRSAANARKRARLFEANEAAQTPEKRLSTRTDLSEPGKNTYSKAWLKKMDADIRLWAEFLDTQHGRNDAGDFFRPNGKLPSIELLNGFTYWVSQTSRGNLYSSSHEPSTLSENSRLAVSTVQGHLTALVAAVAYFNFPIEDSIVKAAQRRVSNQLAAELNLNREHKQRPTAHAADVWQLIKAIWRYESFVVFKNIETMVYTTLILNLLVDGASRIGELLRTDGPGVGLHWQDIEFWVLPSGDDEELIIYSVILCKWIKGGQNNPEVFKKFVIRLLPTEMFFQDSCRLLLLLGLHQGVFRDFSTWDDLLTCQPLNHGSQILFKEEYKKRPVFAPIASRTDRMLSSEPIDDVVSWPYARLQGIVQHLSRLTGLAQKTEIHLLRRGNAFLLLQHCKDREQARKYMGQQTAATFDVYLSKTSTVDLQAISRGLEPKDVSQFSGLTLGCVDNAPITLLARDLDEIEQHDDYIEATRVCSAVEELIIAQYGSLSDLRRAAAAAGSPDAGMLLKQRNNAWRSRYTTFNRLAELRFRHYREARMEELRAAKPVVQQADESTPSNESTDTQASTVDISRLKESVGTLTVEELRSRITEMDNGEDATISDEGRHLLPSHRRHGVFRDDINGQVGQIGRKRNMVQSFSHSMARLAHIFREISSPDEITSSQQMSRIHNLLASQTFTNDLPGHWINKAQPHLCIVCLQALEKESALNHVYKCLEGQIEQQASIAWLSYMETLPPSCDFTSSRSKCKFGERPPLTSPEERQLHHSKAHGRGGQHCRFYCGYGDCSRKSHVETLFTSLDDFAKHTWQEHSILRRSSSKCLWFFCRFCEKFLMLNHDSQEREDHMEGHRQQAMDMVRDFGYAGVRGGLRFFVPAMCIFCLHDVNNGTADRLLVLGSMLNAACGDADIGRHLNLHLSHMEDDDACQCPALRGGMCSYTAQMTRDELWEHISQVHYGKKMSKYGPKNENARRTTRNDPSSERQKRNRFERTKTSHMNPRDAADSDN